MNEIKKCGRLFKFDEKNMIYSNYSLNENTKKICEEFVEKFSQVILSPHSIYLRGSALTKNIIDIFDFDISVIYNSLKETLYSEYTFSQNLVDNILFTVVEKNMTVDVNFYTKEDFINYSERRFSSVLIYGNENLSKNNLHIDEIQILNHEEKISFMEEKITALEYFLSSDNKESKEVLISTIKSFFRIYSLELMLRNRVYTRDIYYCYEYLISEYSILTDDITQLLKLFLNIKTLNNIQLLYSVNILKKLLKNMRYPNYE